MSDQDGSYHVDLEVFSGPFDLLLHLIAKRQLDIHEVDLAEITGDFVASLDGIEDLDLDTATSFLVVASTLLALKSRRLLPVDEQDDEDDVADVRDVLYARLLEYRAFRDVAGELEARLVQHAGYVGRDVGPEPRFRRLRPDAPLGVGAETLARLAAEATAPQPRPHEARHLRRSTLSVRAAATSILQHIDVGDEAAFHELVAGWPLGDRVVAFLALLELHKHGTVTLAQAGAAAPLRCRRRTADAVAFDPADGVRVAAAPTRAEARPRGAHAPVPEAIHG